MAWLSAQVNGQSVADERIETDPERFWDRFQSKTLPALYDHVMALGNGKPRPEDAPFFGELTVDLTLSEPEYRLPVDQEQISSMEALHEEIYFNTLHFFDVMGRFTRGAGLAYPGRVIPVMHPKADGKPGARRFPSPASTRRALVSSSSTASANGRRGEVRLDIPKIAVDRPQTLAATVRAGRDGIDRLDLRVKVDTGKDERDALVKRTRDERVDRTRCSARRKAAAVFANLGRLRAAGLYRDALAYHDLGAVRVTIGPGSTRASRGTETVPRSNRTARRAVSRHQDAPARRRLEREGFSRASRLVQWDTPIPPPEAYEILAKMSTFPKATVYKVGQPRSRAMSTACARSTAPILR